MTASAYFTRTGADLRNLAAAGDAAAQAEIDRRAAKPAKTVAALRSRGDTAAADARIKAHKPAKPAPAPKAEITPVKPVANREAKAVCFTRTHEAVEAKGAIGHLHNRLCAMEAAVVRLAEAQDKTAQLLVRLTSGK